MTNSSLQAQCDDCKRAKVQGKNTSAKPVLNIKVGKLDPGMI